MKKILVPLCVMAGMVTMGAGTGARAADNVQAQLDQLKQRIVELEEVQKKLSDLKKQVADLESSQQKKPIEDLQRQITEVKTHDANDNIKWNIDFRTAYERVDHSMGSGMLPTGVYNMSIPAEYGYGMFAPAGKSDSDNALWTNKLILGMAAQPTDNLVFHGALGVYTVFGQDNMNMTSMFQDFDWYATQKPQHDAVLRLREAYFLYTGEMGAIPYTASLGRRPSVDGFTTNLREDNPSPSSPIGHNINMEFDGGSFKVDLEKVSNVSGLYAKLCLGRGFSNTLGMYSMSNQYNFNAPYGDDGQNPDMDLAGLLMQLYDNGQYKLMGNVFQGWNMMGMGLDIAMSDPTAMSGTYTMSPNGFHDVGDMSGWALSLQVSGIGNDINTFLDDTIVFLSFAGMQTDPNNATVNTLNGSDAMASSMGFGGEGMLGSTDNESGYSIYAGINIPAFFTKDRFGLEYNYGSKYWRSFTYGEDTLAGSKLATRGHAYEAYYTFPIVKEYLTGEIRYVYMDYNYAGSDTFFGQTGDPDGMMGMMPYVESASDIRFSIRYRF